MINTIIHCQIYRAGGNTEGEEGRQEEREDVGKN
jgi:hypothetical protein